MQANGSNWTWMKPWVLLLGIVGLTGFLCVGAVMWAFIPHTRTFKNPSATQVADLWQEIPVRLPPISSASYVHWESGLTSKFVDLSLTATPTLAHQIYKALKQAEKPKRTFPDFCGLGNCKFIIHNPRENPSAHYGEDDYGYPWWVYLSQTHLRNGKIDIKIRAMQPYN